MSSDHIIRGLILKPLVRIVAVVTTDVVREAARRHAASAASTVAMGRAATAALMLATLTKRGERATVEVAGDGPLGPIHSDATDSGDVRVMIKHPRADFDVVRASPGQIARGVGRGVVSVLRDLGLEERFTGHAPIVSGEIDTDIEHYLRTSEQVESALGCDVVLGDTGEICAAGGVLAQCMPGQQGLGIVRELRSKLRNGRLWAAMVGPDGLCAAEDIARYLLGDRAEHLDVLDVRPVRFHCACSRERVCAALRTLNADEIAAMIREDDGGEVGCDYCREQYKFSASELAALL